MKRIIYLQIAWLTFLLGLGLAAPVTKKNLLSFPAKEPVTFELVRTHCWGSPTEWWRSSSGTIIRFYADDYKFPKEAQNFLDNELSSRKMQLNDFRTETTEDLSQDSIRIVGTFVNRASGAKQFVIIRRDSARVYEIEADDLDVALRFESLKVSQPEASQLSSK